MTDLVGYIIENPEIKVKLTGELEEDSALIFKAGRLLLEKIYGQEPNVELGDETNNFVTPGENQYEVYRIDSNDGPLFELYLDPSGNNNSILVPIHEKAFLYALEKNYTPVPDADLELIIKERQWDVVSES